MVGVEVILPTCYRVAVEGSHQLLLEHSGTDMEVDRGGVLVECNATQKHSAGHGYP